MPPEGIYATGSHLCHEKAGRGRHVLGWPCLSPRSQWRLVHCCRSLGRQAPTPEVTSSETNAKGNVDKTYTGQQRDVILHLLNTASESQLDCVKELQGKKAASIVQYREENGLFQDLNTLHQVPQFQSTLIHKVCTSILNYSAKADGNVMAKFLKPDIPLCKLRGANSIVSIVFGLKKLAWVHIDCTMTVKEWQQQECFHFMKGKHLPELYLEDISLVVTQIPQADFYILERPAVSNQNSSLFPVLLHLRTVEAMLYCLLNPRLLEKQQHCVFSMNRNTVGKHFEIMVGESRTSGVDIVQRLIQAAIAAPKPRVNFSPELIHQYRHQLQARGQNRNEEMCDALLQAVTFYELVSF
ncbi:transcription elongation factor, mitochondrial isoform X2 [Pyxicephalus adspersus]|uniref:transcription elongation factor, mitochondrial isoform X2 n=1 Tax=Pyxicephalus adspersus TaxID=30357 RepID=UPI003B58C62A